jgi:hypothetical protein
VRSPLPLLWAATLFAVGLASTATPLRAQGFPVASVARIGGELDRLQRLTALGDSVADLTALNRAFGRQLSPRDANRDAGHDPRHDAVLLFAPELFSVAHTAHPWRGNDGALRAGVGRNLLLTAGLAYQANIVSFTLLPQLLHEENGRFQTIPYPQDSSPPRSVWANPFYGPSNSLDYPLRFGSGSRTTVEWQGRLAVTFTPALRIGAGREERWWGPGVENALVLSNNAPALEQIFIESAAPIETAAGRFSYVYLLARVNESEFFDEDASNDRRTLSAGMLIWDPAPRFSLLPTLGLTRAVLNAEGPTLANAFSLFADAGRPWARPEDAARGMDQITGVFAHWRAPSERAAAWVEWVRYEQPASLREFLEQPGHSQGYTLGLEQARPLSRGTLHYAAEFSYMEPSTSIRTRPVETSYVGKGTVQGWTQEGQMLGPWIGPGASSQWLRADYRTPGWRTGVTLGRLRRDANVRFQNLPNLSREDVQLYASARYARTWRGLDWQLEYTEGARLNHLYQSYPVPGATGGETRGIDLLNRSLALTISAQLPQEKLFP